MSRAEGQGRNQNLHTPAPMTASEGMLTDGIAAAARNPINVEAERAVQLAASLYRERKFDQAERVCRQTIDARLANADAHSLLSISLQALGRGTEAVKELRLAVNLASTAPNLRGNLGEVLRQIDKLDEAESELPKAIFERRKYEETVSFYRQAIEIRPDMSEALNTLAIR